MIDKKIKFNEEEQSYRAYYTEKIDGVITCKWDELLSESELLEMYNENPDAAKKDDRLESILTPKVPEPTIKDVMQCISDMEIALINSGVI